jgi:hypothetical protein
MTRWSWLLVLALVAAAHAEPKPIDDATRARAIAHFRQGDEYFKRAQWDQSIVEYQAAFDLTGEPLMLFDIALANDKAGRVEPAFDGYVRYLREVALGDAADEARAAKARLQPAVDKLRAERAVQEKAAADARAEAERALAERRAAARAEADVRAGKHDRRARTLTIGALGIGGAGVVALVFGAKLGLDARSIADEITHHEGGWTEADLVRDQDGRDANRKMIILTTIGGALVTTGAVLYVLGRRARGRAESIRLDATRTSGGMTVSIGGQWRW